MTDYPIFAPKRITLDSENVSIFATNDDAFTFNGSRVLSETNNLTLTPIGSVPNSNGASLVNDLLTLQPCDATHPGLITTGTQSIPGNKTFTGNVILPSVYGITPSGSTATVIINASGELGTGSSASITLDPIGSSPNANGATITGSVLKLQPASGSFGGILSDTTQDIPGEKTMKNILNLSKNLNFESLSDDPTTGCLMINDIRFLHSPGFYDDGENLFIGKNCGHIYDPPNFSGTIGIGDDVFPSLTDGGGNVAIGLGAGNAATDISNCVFVGAGAGSAAESSCNDLICIGPGAGGSYQTNNFQNIVIGNSGVSTDTNIIRIGTNGSHSACLLQGIDGVVVAGASAVVIDADGQLGTIVSTLKRKRDIENIPQKDIDSFYHLQPKRFKYLQEQDPSEEQQWGLIAEQTQDFFPEMIVYEDEEMTIPKTIQYHKLNCLLFAVVQQQDKRIKLLEEQIKSLF